MKRLVGRAVVVGAAAVAATVLAACSGVTAGEGERSSSPTSPSSSGATTDPEAAPELDVALSEPQEDSLYPRVGDPSVDALHYDLTLDWDPDTDTLTGTEVLTFRSTTTGPKFQLDFGIPLAVETLTLDGVGVPFQERGKDLVVTADVVEDQRYELELTYAGTPAPVPVPTMRSDFSGTGFTITETHETWTMQEPYGAFTWYAVNDHPSDKALYDFTLSVASPWVGVANGTLESRTDEGGTTTTTFSLDDPAASYLTTVAFGDFEQTEDRSESGVPISYWVNRAADPGVLSDLRVTPEAMAWLEDLLGPYPYDTFGVLVVDSESGMETQTLVTLGDTEYTTSAKVVLHELAHHWYGDTVTPDDWRDVWMNEGMAMYLQGMWEADHGAGTIDEVMDGWAQFEDEERTFAGPPADYDKDSFGSGNIYYGPALMWHELRQMIGDERFFDVVRGWPEANANGNAGRDDYLPWLEEQTGEELTEFFDAWLLGDVTPPRD
ncbi:metallopeptidase [Nocardioides szechwanensis]|uniref:Aminopeptidase N n=1 Tax=Nocardioides szechwanensis TaxID=1005944 RepID=A0A1H0EC90_9ACTN|nr:metallopeptidase [Nocardioides szechwanensis]SDN79936.1 Peptidase family M1 [Nocardioides szechwanensis]